MASCARWAFLPLAAVLTAGCGTAGRGDDPGPSDAAGLVPGNVARPASARAEP